MAEIVDTKVKYSIVIPVYNEEESLVELLSEINAAMRSFQPYEVIFVDDCSSDASKNIINKFVNDDSSIVKVIWLNTRGGQTFALRQGLDAARGEVVITLDADLQNDPADIPKLLEKINQGNDCVCGWRKARQDTWLKAVLSKTGNIVQRLLTGLKVHDVSCTLRAYKQACVSKIPLNWEGQHRFIALSLCLQGFKIDEIVSNHRKRKFGVSKYRHGRIFRVMADFFKILATRGTR